MNRLLFPFVGTVLSERTLEATLRLARAQHATLMPAYIALVPRTLSLDAAARRGVRRRACAARGRRAAGGARGRGGRLADRPRPDNAAGDRRADGRRAVRRAGDPGSLASQRRARPGRRRLGAGVRADGGPRAATRGRRLRDPRCLTAVKARLQSEFRGCGGTRGPTTLVGGIGAVASGSPPVERQGSPDDPASRSWVPVGDGRGSDRRGRRGNRGRVRRPGDRGDVLRALLRGGRGQRGSWAVRSVRQRVGVHPRGRVRQRQWAPGEPQRRRRRRPRVRSAASSPSARPGSPSSRSPTEPAASAPAATSRRSSARPRVTASESSTAIRSSTAPSRTSRSAATCAGLGSSSSARPARAAAAPTRARRRRPRCGTSPTHCPTRRRRRFPPRAAACSRALSRPAPRPSPSTPATRAPASAECSWRSTASRRASRGTGASSTRASASRSSPARRRSRGRSSSTPPRSPGATGVTPSASASRTSRRTAVAARPARRSWCSTVAPPMPPPRRRCRWDGAASAAWCGRARAARGPRVVKLFGGGRVPVSGRRSASRAAIPTDRTGAERVLNGAAVTGADGAASVKVRGQSSRFIRATYFAGPEQVITKRIRLDVSPGDPPGDPPDGQGRKGRQDPGRGRAPRQVQGAAPRVLLRLAAGARQVRLRHHRHRGRARVGYKTEKAGKLRIYAKVPNQRAYPYSRGRSVTKVVRVR